MRIFLGGNFDMMSYEAFLRSIAAWTFFAKGMEQVRILVSEEKDGRYNGWMTQAYGLVQDVQDKIREEKIDAPIQMGSAPNLPTSGGTQNPNVNGGLNPIPPNPTNPSPTVNPVTGNPSNPNNGGNASLPFNNPGGTAQNPGGASQQQIADFFSQVLAGKTSSNGDLDDLLNQFINAQAQNNGQNTGNGANQANF